MPMPLMTAVGVEYGVSDRLTEARSFTLAMLLTEMELVPSLSVLAYTLSHL